MAKTRDGVFEAPRIAKEFPKTKALDASRYVVSFTVERPLASSARRSASDYWYAVEGEIKTLDESRDPVDTVGWISARVVQLGRALNEDADMEDVVYRADRSLRGYCSAFVDREGCLRRELNPSFKRPPGQDLLIVERIEILPATGADASDRSRSYACSTPSATRAA